jgi:hypothetical protein
MDFFAGFSWPVPTAFAAAVAACRFEQGDVLYSSKRAYRAWDPVRSELRHHIQVLDPPRSARAMTAEGDGSRFSANWSSSVQLELKEYRSSSTETWRSTQGRLFSCLWQGDVSWLDEEERGAPPPPLLARELHKALQESLETAAERFRVALPSGVSPRLLYLSALDQASDASRAKASLVESQLASRFAVVTADLAPSRAGIAEAERYHPSLAVRCLALDTPDESAVREVLKKALYAPSKTSKSGGSAERFALQRHGALVIG